MKILSFIPARGDSKGIPLKNISMLNDKPLLFYTINASLNSNLITRTIVSTDNEKIAQTAIKLGAEVVKRPKRLADDKAVIEPAILHTLEYLKKKEDYKPEIILLLSNTSPLKTTVHIDEMLNKLIKSKFDSILSVCSFHHFQWSIQKDSSIKPINYSPATNRPNRQEMETPLLENGAMFATTFSAFKKSGARVSGKIGFYEMPLDCSYNIDSKKDLLHAEQLLNKLNRSDDDFFSVKGKNIVITGSSGLLGSYYSQILCERGANLALIDKNTDLSISIAKKYSTDNQIIKVYKCDLSKPIQITKTFKQIKNDFKFIDVLINNAAFGSKDTFHVKDFKNYEKHPFNLWKKSFEVNVDAVHLCTQQVIGIMKKRRSGSIINISSNYGLVGPSFDTYENEELWTPPGYATTKSALLNFSRYIANLYGKYNIRCNTFIPSGVATETLSKSFIKKYASRTAFGRMATPGDYGGSIVFLCSDASKYMTGSNLIVDGGWTSR